MTTSIDWIEAGALVIAVASVVIGVCFNRKTLKLTELHNKKTIEPHITDMFEALVVLERGKIL